MGQAVAKYSDMPAGFSVYSDIPSGFSVAKEPQGPAPDERTAGQVAWDQTKNVVSGIPKAITGIPDALVGAVGALKDMVTGKGTGQAQQMIAGAVEPFTTSAKGALSLAGVGNFKEGNPADPSWERAAEGAGANLGGILLGEGISRGARAASPIVSRAAKGLYQKALQPPPRAYSPGEIQSMLTTGIGEKLPIGLKGLNKLDTLVNQLNDSIEQTIATNPNVHVSPQIIANRVAPDVLKKAQTQVNPVADVNAVQSSMDEFVNSQPPVITAEEAQALKKGTYRQIYSKGEGELGTSSKNAQAQLARGIKEELEQIFPELKKVNAREGKLIDLRPELEAATSRLGNRRLSVANALNVMADPRITSRIAIHLQHLGVPATEIAGRIGQLQRFTGGPATKEQQ